MTTQHQAPEVTIDDRTFAEHVCTAIYHALVADFGSMHMGVDRLDTMAGPQASLLFFKPLDGPDAGLRYATVCGQSVSQAVNDAIRSWHEQAEQAPDAATRATQPLSLTVDEEAVERAARAISLADVNYDFDALGKSTKEHYRRMARAALGEQIAENANCSGDIDRSGLAQEVG